MDQPDIFSLLPEKALSVAQFLNQINELLQPVTVTVRGEISSMQERPKAIYFSITDTEEQAKLDCVLWRRNSEYYKSMLKEGAEIEVTGSPNIYKPFGKFSFITSTITPVGEGALQAAFEALKRQLEKDGYFAAERKRTLPPFVQSIGLITSLYGDARKDFLTHLGNHGFAIAFQDARVEGANAIKSLVDAIEWFNSQAKPVDVLVLTRGGGSLESLQAFNSPELAQAIFKSRIPVVSAIGHENDVTIADMVADVRASTPTHAGKMLAEPWILAAERVEMINRNVLQCFNSAASQINHSFDQTQLRIVHSFFRALEQEKTNLSLTSSSMISHFRAVFTRFERLEQSVQHAGGIFWMHLQKQQQRLTTCKQLISSADPHQKLKQGYSMTFTPDGKLVKKSTQLNQNDELVTRLGQGSVLSTVSSIE